MVDPAKVSERLEEEWKAELDADCTISLADPIQPTVPPGLHDAICVSVRKVTLPTWHRAGLVFQFKIREVSPSHGVLLHGYINLGEKTHGRKTQSAKRVALKTPSDKSKLARWWRIILGFDPTLSHKHVDLRLFRSFLYRVLVTNVETDNRQRSIAAGGQYQVVSEIVAVVQRLGLKA